MRSFWSWLKRLLVTRTAEADTPHPLVDLLHARRERTRMMLRDATHVPYRGLDIAVVRPEDLIGLKLQAIKNRPERPYDRGDIERIVAHYGARLDVERIRDYCDHLGLAHELEWIKARIAAAAR